MQSFFRHVVVYGITLAALDLGISPAHADMIYDFQAGITTGSNGLPAPALSFVLTLDSNFQPGSFSRQCDSISCVGETGSFSDFTLSAFEDGKLFATLDNTPDHVLDDTYGDFLGSSGTLQWTTSESNFDLTFGAGVWSASFNSDEQPYLQACYNGNCQAAGAVAAVPEPGSLFVLVTGLLVLAFAMRGRLVFGS